MFKPYPYVSYDLKKNKRPILLTDISVRFKLQQAFGTRPAVYFDYSIKEGDRADIIAHKYYGDTTLDWFIFITNLIIDPYWQWPLNYHNFVNYIKGKYGSTSAAQGAVHHYEKILNAQSVLWDDTIIPERTLRVDLETYNALGAANRKIVYKYNHEDNENEKLRNIKIMDKGFARQVLQEVDGIFD